MITVVSSKAQSAAVLLNEAVLASQHDTRSGKGFRHPKFVEAAIGAGRVKFNELEKDGIDVQHGADNLEFVDFKLLHRKGNRLHTTRD